MDILIYVMVYAGAALMVYNIVRCYGFVKNMRSMSGMESLRPILPVPLILLVLFLIGYLAVGFFGDPDWVIGGILFGGSLFVFIVLGILYKVIDRLQEGSSRSDALYDEVKSNLEGMTKDYLSIMRVNLTKDRIESISGIGLYEDDLDHKSYTGLLAKRGQGVISNLKNLEGGGKFTRDALLEQYNAGQSVVEETLFNTLASGQMGFVALKAQLTTQPGTNDVVAFITERPYDDEMVNETLLTKALIGQFDMITYLVDGRYGVVIGDDTPRDGSIFPAESSGDYQAYLDNQVAPVICGTQEEKAALLDALSLESVHRELSRHEPYEVNIAVDVDGGVFYKRFVFYVVDADVQFYLLLKSDTTETRREEIERNEQLQQALEEAQRASAAKTTFLSNMSHDIRTPMNAIVGYTELAKKSDDIGQEHEYLEKIDASSKYLLALINDVLEMSRIESGKLDLVLEEVDLVKVMDDARDMFDMQMREAGIDFEVDASQVQCGYVRCDKSRFNRVLLNLLSNACKFTPADGSVHVSLVQTDGAPEGFGAYELRVKDTGIGMTEEFAEKVFEAFERERNSTASGIQGTGLGMAISKRIVEAMGGTIEVVTKQGEGTEFIVRAQFELQRDRCASAAGVCALSPSAEEEEIDFEGMKVLLVEDNAINRDIATIVLEDIGFVVDEAVDGKEAVDKLVAAGAGCYNIVVTDIQMPVMDGYEEARAIRALDDSALASIPIVAMSANAFQEDVQASLGAGMNAHISKPIDVGVLVDTLTDVLRRS